MSSTHKLYGKRKRELHAELKLVRSAWYGETSLPQKLLGRAGYLQVESYVAVLGFCYNRGACSKRPQRAYLQRIHISANQELNLEGEQGVTVNWLPSRRI